MSVTTNLIEKVREIAAVDPDYIYENPVGEDSAGEEIETCVYVWKDKPSCIMGRALFAIGFADSYSDVWESTSVGSVLSELDVRPNPRQEKWLMKVQIEQDSGTPYGRCIEIADRNHPLQEGAS